MSGEAGPGGEGRRRGVLVAAAALLAAIGGLRRPRTAPPPRIARRTTPGTRHREIESGGARVRIREDLLEGGIYRDLRIRGERP